MKEKLLKDPIYGYIRIQDEIARDIIDSPCFQRLRRIRQTSYAPLYSASIHNRFTHSIGVYYLGKIAFNSFKDSVTEKIKTLTYEVWCNLETIFTIACLLHDVGHAPFSHTGEHFFLYESTKGSPDIDTKLKQLVNTEDFRNDILYYNQGKKAAPHEIMSAIVGITNFSNYIKTHDDKDFFARCITGYTYRDSSDELKEIKNCLISLLNSSIIDVDKLDYILRDAYMTGFQNVSIDYFRLLDSVTIVEKGDKKFLAYNKRALSVIENVIYAHDSERKWIQSHPVVLYEHFLIQHGIKKTVKLYNDRLFNECSLSSEGNDYQEKGRIRLLADEDIIYNMKNVCIDELTNEYFSRRLRRHPIWKSEAEYRALFECALGSLKLDELEIAFKNIEKYINDNLKMPIINEDLVKHCEDELENLKKLTGILKAKDINNKRDGLQNVLKWARAIKEYCQTNCIPYSFVVISANKFKSGFLKEELANILIYFPNFNRVSYLKDILDVLSPSHNTRKNFFYLYYQREEKEIDIVDFSKFLCAKVIND